MSKKDVTFQYCDEIIDQFEKVCKHPIVEKSSVYYAGVDLGTACIVVAVLDENRRPAAISMRMSSATVWWSTTLAPFRSFVK